MAFFDGDYKKKRNISLGGVRNNEYDRQQLLRRAQEERKAREHERLRVKSATQIQAFFRGRLAVGRAHAQAREEFDSESVCFRWDDLDCDKIATKILSFGTKLCWFYHRRWDLQRAEWYAHMLLERTILKGKGDGAGQELSLLFVPFVSEKSVNEWQRHLRKLLPMFMSNFLVNSGLAKKDEKRANNFMAVVQAIMDPRGFGLAETLNPQLKQMKPREHVMRFLLSDYFYPQLGCFLESMSIEEKSLPSVSAAVHLALQPFRITPPNSQEETTALDGLIQYILCLPCLPNRLDIPDLKSMSVNIPFESIVLRIADHVETTNRLNVEQGLALAGNLLAFGKPRSATMSLHTLNAYLRSLQIILLRTPGLMLSVNEKGDNDEDEEDDEEEGESGSRGKEIYPPLDPKLVKWLSLLYDQQHLMSLIRPRNHQTDRPHLTALAGFLSALLSRWTSRRTEVMTAILRAGERELLRACWDVFRSSGLHAIILELRQVENVISDPQHADDWCILALLAELYSRSLITMGDDEFFSEKNDLTTKEIIGLSQILRNVAFSLWSSDVLYTKHAKFDRAFPLHIRSVSTKLVQQFHARDARRPFCPRNHWLMTSHLDIAAFRRSTATEEEEHMALELTSEQPVEVTSPRLNVLHHIPFVIPFEERVAIFRQFIAADRQRNSIDEYFHRDVARVSIRRDHIFEDGYNNLRALGTRLKGKVAITFISDFGMEEAGIDGGGVFKEFMTALSKEAFDAKYGLFKASPEELLYPNPQAYAVEEQQLSYFKFLGTVIGKAIYEGILFDAAFAPFFLSKWLGRQNYLDDLPSLDMDLYKGLIYLKNYTGDLEDLALNFTTTDVEFGTTRIVELIPGGSDIPVTNENRIRYIYLVAHHRLNTQIQRQCRAFFSGLAELIEPKWLRMFDQQEIQILLSGSPTPIDVDDLRRHVTYSGPYDDQHPVIVNFWSVMEDMDGSDRRKLVKFVTSVERPPLLGFKELNPPFCIRYAGAEVERLPTSSTCVNLLKLPPYTSKEMMKEKLMYAVHSGAGFDLS